MSEERKAEPFKELKEGVVECQEDRVAAAAQAGRG